MKCQPIRRQENILPLSYRNFYLTYRAVKCKISNMAMANWEKNTLIYIQAKPNAKEMCPALIEIVPLNPMLNNAERGTIRKWKLVLGSI